MSSEMFNNAIHWRLNTQRYRLEGYKFANGEVSLQKRQIQEPVSGYDQYSHLRKNKIVLYKAQEQKSDVA